MNQTPLPGRPKATLVEKEARSQDLTTFFERVDRLLAADAIREGPLSSRLFGAADRLAQIRAGSDVGARRLARAALALTAIEREVAGLPQPHEAASGAGAGSGA